MTEAGSDEVSEVNPTVIDLEDPANDRIWLKHSRMWVHPDQAFPRIRIEYAKLFKTQEQLALSRTDDQIELKRKLKDYQAVIKDADQATFLERDESTWGPLLGKAQAALTRELQAMVKTLKVTRETPIAN